MADKEPNANPFAGVKQEVEGEQNESSSQEQSNLSEVEARAYEKGWRPKEEYDENSGKPWISAEEFERRGELFARIESQNKKIRELEKDLDAVVKYNKKLAEEEKQQAIETLEKVKANAIKEGDGDTVTRVEKQIKEVEKMDNGPKTTNPNPVYESWVAKNEWYLTDPEMHEFADSVGAGYYGQNKGTKTEQEVFDYVEKQVKRAFPDKFAAPVAAKREAATVDSASRTTSSTTKKSGVLTEKDLSDDERRVMRVFMQRLGKDMTKEKYLDQLAQAKGLK